VRLEDRRKTLGLSRKEAAKQTGISEVSMWQYEKGGGYRPKTEIALRLAKLYGCSVEEIMEGCGDSG
jgi:DNA-binding XRE family transcriptional regulator